MIFLANPLMDKPLSLGVDFGTSGIRCHVINPHGKVMASSRRYIATSINAAGLHEQSPTQWWQDLLETFASIPAEIRSAVGRLSINGTSGSLLLADANGEPVSQCLMYNDTRTTAEAEYIKRIAPRNCGAHGTGSSLAKALWLQRVQTRQQKHLLLHQADYLSNRLAGQWGITDYNNALKLGYNAKQQHWPSWLTQSKLPTAWLPEVVSPGTEIGKISAIMAAATGLPVNTKVCAGTTDSVAAFIATGIETPDIGMSSIGSTLALKQLSQTPLYAPQYGIYSHRFGEQWLVGGASNCGGAALLNFFSLEDIISLSTKIDPETDSGVIYYPLRGTGERFPLNDPELTAQLSPDLSDNPTHFLHGLLEGLARVEKFAWQRLQSLGAPAITRVTTTGGGANNDTLTQLRQRILNLPVQTAQYSDAAYGSALLAQRGLP